MYIWNYLISDTFWEEYIAKNTPAPPDGWWKSPAPYRGGEGGSGGVKIMAA